MTELAYIIVDPDGRRLEWTFDAAHALERCETRNHYRYGRGLDYEVRTVDADLIVNEYPQDEIPEPGGYNLIADMDDGDTPCEWCVRDPFNPVTDGRAETFDSSGHGSGWHVIGWSTTGDTDSYTVCAHCNRVLVEGTETEE